MTDAFEFLHFLGGAHRTFDKCYIIRTLGIIAESHLKISDIHCPHDVQKFILQI
jgi:hypothetical protein